MLTPVTDLFTCIKNIKLIPDEYENPEQVKKSSSHLS